MNANEVFGDFITRKRTEKEITLRKFSVILNLSPVYVCNFEKGRKPAPKREILDQIVEVLRLSKEEAETMYDLASQSKKSDETVPADLSTLINSSPIVVTALRTAKDVDATDKEWQEFIQKLEARKKGGQ